MNLFNHQSRLTRIVFADCRPILIGIIWLLICGLGGGVNLFAAATQGSASGGSLLAGEPPGTVRAWIRCNATAQSYCGQPYWWLGDSDFSLKIMVPPVPGHELAVLWGAKNDQRTAMIRVNDHPLPVTAGQYNGFRWLRIPFPTNLKGDHYELGMTTGSGGKPAFFGEVRLIDPTGKTHQPVHFQAPAEKMILEAVTPATRITFPEMRLLWDQEPVYSGMTNHPFEAAFRRAEKNARWAAEAFYRCRRYVDGWLAHADPVTGLIPRNLGQSRDFWNGRDAAADNYVFMVLTAALTDRDLFEGRMLEMLRTEQRVTARLDRLCDDYSFSKKGWRRENLDLDAIIFDSAEYVKDGLIPVTEWLGPSPWSERMIGLVDDIWKHAAIETPYGNIPTLNFEVNGDLLQSCARLYWYTGKRQYLDWAIRLGDYYLLGTNHPTRDLDELRLNDHGCEVVNGLSELYLAVARGAPEKYQAYQAPLHALYDRILEVGRNPDGFLYHSINPKTGANSGKLCDTWGYNYDGVYTVFLVDGVQQYRNAVCYVLGNLGPSYYGRPWADQSQDGIADAVEGALNLYNREIIPAAAAWIEFQMRLLWDCQQPDGTIERWHGDGNFARTSLMYALWKTQGLHIDPWRQDVCFGAEQENNQLLISLKAQHPWKGKLFFDRPRHREFFHLPLDYPRINQFPEWFTVQANNRFALEGLTLAKSKHVQGHDLREGLPLELAPAKELRLIVRLLSDPK